ncbi:flagellar hook protein FlgE [Amnibacterium endophyticum]|uniref:Flagellar hook protein FlgE n=1 Tax=Amnibacterium endophyticum TaxID=2109337 RepID=A0ABW4LDG3_9MICO
MLRSLYAGISGLRAEQTMLDVTSNNIANVNTVGFKSSAVHFEDTLSQTLQSAGLAQSYKAGTNPSQIGLGVRVADVSMALTQGSQQSTGSNLDTMISGDGYFTTKIGSQTLYTRNGSFHFDSEGRLATAGGALVQGWTAVDGQVNPGLTPGPITLNSAGVTKATQTTKATLTGNIPVDGTAAFSRDIPVYAADGSTKTLTVKFTPSATTAGAYDYVASDDDGATAAATGTLTFVNGKLATGSDSVKTTGDGITLDFSGMSGYAGLNTATFADQNGNQAGTLLSYTMGADGTLTGTFSNGDTVPLARLALSTFQNPNGLEKAGSTSFTESINSGAPKFGVAGSDGFGAITAGALEASNVDLSQEFTNLIVAQRGFQANARIITTSDEILQELTQLKR